MILDLTRDTVFGFIPAPLPLKEFFDMIILSLALGYIFKDFFRLPPSGTYDPLTAHKQRNYKQFLFAVAVTAPAVIFHEAAHKFVALSFGIPATFYAAYGFLAIGVLLKLVGSPIIFFVPGFVSHPVVPALPQMFISLSGPLMNLILWIIAASLLKWRTFFKTKQSWLPYLFLTKKINIFLFFFNMLPFGPFDGGQFVRALLSMW